MNICVCVGSSCHLKGSYNIIALMKSAIAEQQLEDKVNLCAAFCLGKCSTVGVNIKIDDEIVTGVTPENFNQVFEEKILGGLAK